MKIYSKLPAPANVDAPHVKHKSALLAELNAIPAGESIDFDQVRAKLSLDAEALPDGSIHQVALDAGYKVEL